MRDSDIAAGRSNWYGEGGGLLGEQGNLQLDSFLHIHLLQGNLPINFRNLFVHRVLYSWISDLKDQTEQIV